jgi:hypothetical protein
LKQAQSRGEVDRMLAAEPWRPLCGRLLSWAARLTKRPTCESMAGYDCRTRKGPHRDMFHTARVDAAVAAKA